MSRLRRFVVAAAFIATQCCYAPSHARIEIDRAKLEKWADEYFGAALGQHRIAGAALSAVQDGEVILLKGYGYADHARGLPLDPAETRLRVCSNSKIFTATALLQLADRGLIRSLEDPANHYLKRFQLPVAFGREITVRDLLTHRAGFGAALFGEGTIHEVPAPLPGAAYDRLLAGLVNEPGAVSVYANSALAVQGALVEDLGGATFTQYVRENIFMPLGMHDSLIHANPEPPPRLAVPYRFYPSGALEPVPFVAKHPAFAPSGGVVTTAADMAKFMIAQAGEGNGAGRLLLSPDTFRRMHSQQVTNHPLLPGFGLQYFTSRTRGERVAAHDCGLPGFSTAHEIYPDSDAGIFVALLSAPLRPTLWEQLAPRLVRTRMTPEVSFSWAERLKVTEAIRDFRADVLDIHAESAEPAQDLRPSHDLAAYAGRYLDDGHPVGNMLSLPAALLEGAASVIIEGDELMIFGEGPYREIAPDVFQHASNGERVAFIRGQDGTVSRVVNSYTAFKRMGFFDDPHRAAWAFVACFALSLVGVIGLVWVYGLRQRPVAIIAQTTMVLTLASVTWCLFLGFSTDGRIENFIDYVNAGLTPRLWIISAMMNLFFLATIAMLWIAAASWRGGGWGVQQLGAKLQRAHYTALALAGCLTWPFLWNFHLIGLQVP